MDLLTASNKKITFCWVPSHVVVHGNEVADKAARDSCVAELEANQSLPHSDYYPVINRKISERWLESWNSLQGNKLRIIKNDVSMWQMSCRLNRIPKTVLTRLRIGHSRLTHKHLLEGELPPLCEEYYVALTINHILVKCPEYADQRLATFGADGIVAPVYLKDILGNKESSVTDLFSFLNRTRIVYDI